MTDKKDTKDKKETSPPPIPQTRSNALLQTITRINSQLFPRIIFQKDQKSLASSREQDSPNSSIRLRKGHTISMQLSKAESPQNFPINLSKEQIPSLLPLPLNQIKRLKKPPSKSLVRKIEDDDGLRKRSNTLEEINATAESPVVVKKVLKRLQTDRKIEPKKVSPSQRALKSFRDNSPKILAELKDTKKLRPERNLRGYSMGGMEDLTNRNSPVRLVDIREKKASQPNLNPDVKIINIREKKGSQPNVDMQSQISSLLKESKLDFSRDRKKLKRMMNEHRKDMDQISKKHFKPSFKLRWAVNVLGKPPVVDYRDMYSCSKPGFVFFRKKFMNMDQEI